MVKDSNVLFQPFLRVNPDEIEQHSSIPHDHPQTIPTTDTSPQTYEDFNLQTFAQNWESQLHSLLSKCIFKKHGFWTYEVCPFQHIQQYHLNKDNSRDPLHSLGNHDQQLSQSLSVESLTDIISHTNMDNTNDNNDLLAYEYIQYFTGGSDGRQSRVKFKCPNWVSEPLALPPPGMEE